MPNGPAVVADRVVSLDRDVAIVNVVHDTRLWPRDRAVFRVSELSEISLIIGTELEDFGIGLVSAMKLVLDVNTHLEISWDK